MHPRCVKYRRRTKGLVELNGRLQAHAARAKGHAFSASGRIISAFADPNSDVAVPSRTRPLPRRQLVTPAKTVCALLRHAPSASGQFR
jgi:hypothetical protein